METYDFSGWATKNDLKCSDGRTIIRNAFKDNDGTEVPLVWSHLSSDPDNILGHALLENRDEGVYAYCSFNDNPKSQRAKRAVQHGDIKALSIFANRLQEKGSNVLHGSIKEVSLVMAGANPGAFIDSIMAHGEESDESAVIYTDEEICLYHADATKVTIGQVFDTMTSKQSDEVYTIVGGILDGKIKRSDLTNDDSDTGNALFDLLDKLNENQQSAVLQVIEGALSKAGSQKDEPKTEEPKTEPKQASSKEDDENKTNFKTGGKSTMKHNLFDNSTDGQENKTLSHDELRSIITDAKKYGSLKESFIAHADTYGINEIETLFPEAKAMTNDPEFIKRDDSWVSKVMSGVHHTPFSRIKSVFADIREDEARAKGYVKGNLKKEEVFGLLKRTTTPTTIYKKQKLDRDDTVDITDFDVVSWIKREMRIMLDEEIARAVLIGDGRLASSDDKVNEQCIRPIWKDADLYTIKANVAFAAGDDDQAKAKKFINTVIKQRKNYKGSGNPTLFTTEDVVTDCLLIEDGIGHKLYKSVDELATTLRVKEIITVEVMENATREDGGDTKQILALLVNLNDYTMGADKGGAVSMFDDFDIDYNQMKYLMETRCSGAMTKPFGAIAFEFTVPSAGPIEEDEP